MVGMHQHSDHKERIAFVRNDDDIHNSVILITNWLAMHDISTDHPHRTMSSNNIKINGY